MTRVTVPALLGAMFPMCCCASKKNESVVFANDPSSDETLAMTSSAMQQQIAEDEACDPMAGSADEQRPAITPEVAGSSQEDGCEPQPGETFSVTIPRSRNTNIGLDTDLIDDQSVMVVAIKSGVFQSWNDANPNRAIKLHDRIVEVNGVRDNTTVMINTLKQEAHWKLQVQRPKEFSIELMRTKTPSLGLDLRYAPNGTSLLIRDIGEGPVLDWNTANPDRKVCKHDRIIELNGTRGTPQQILEASVGISQMDITILHYGV